jgi:hypothetical protein
MANVHMLNLVVRRLENAARNFEKLAYFLNLRVMNVGSRNLFKGFPYREPKPGSYLESSDALAGAADLLFQTIDAQGLVLRSQGIEIAQDLPAKVDSTADQLLGLIASWQVLHCGIITAILRLHGLEPLDIPEIPHPAFLTERRLCAEILAWMEKIAADANQFAIVQGCKSKSHKSKKRIESNSGLARLEQGLHRLVDNYMRLAPTLPYHLEHSVQLLEREGR